MSKAPGRLSALISMHQDQILRDWSGRATRSVAARGLSAPELRNSLPGLLHALANDANPDEALRAYAESHLGARIALGYPLAEVIHEFVMLEEAVLSVNGRLPPAEQLSEAERSRLGQAVRSTIVHITDLFQDHMSLNTQRDKRYLRLLQTIANQALREPEAPLDARLDEVLDLIMEAMHAQSAALLFYDAHTEHLITKASAGRARDALRELTTSLDPAQFTGQVAKRVIPVTTETASGELEVTPALREAGIEVLLGVRLPPAASLLGIVFVGLAERRTFTPQERMRLEMLGRWLTLQLDNARLYGDLRATNQQLRNERDLRERSVAMLAHDLRGPLSVASLNSQLVRRDPHLNPRHRQILQRGDQNLKLVERMLRDLLDVYRLHSGGRLPLRIERHDLVDIARTAVEELRQLHGDQFVLEADEPVEGYWSADELGRALWNLGVNADRYGAPGGLVRVRVQRSPDRAQLSVHNLGPPIPQERLTALLRPPPGAPPVRESGGGWGLGLQVVRAVTKAHGGTLQAWSDATGTTFCIELPYDARQAQGS